MDSTAEKAPANFQIGCDSDIWLTSAAKAAIVLGCLCHGWSRDLPFRVGIYMSRLQRLISICTA